MLYKATTNTHYFISFALYGYTNIILLDTSLLLSKSTQLIITPFHDVLVITADKEKSIILCLPMKYVINCTTIYVYCTTSYVS